MIAAMAAHGFTQAQLKHIDTMIRDGLTTVGPEANKMVEEAKERTRETVIEMEGRIAKQQNEIMEILKNAEESHARMNASVAEKEAQILKLAEMLGQHEIQKGKIIEELDGRQKEMEQFRTVIESVSAETRQALNQVTGGWKGQVEKEVTDARAFLDNKIAELNMQSSGFGQRVQAIEAALTAGANAGAKGSGRGASGYVGSTSTNNPVREGLIDGRDFKLPEFPSNKPNPDDFRKWLRAFCRYCSRRPGFPAPELVVMAIRESKDPIDHYQAKVDLILSAQSQKNDEFQEGPPDTLSTYWTVDRERELYEGLEVALGGRCEEQINACKRGDGYELLRILIATFDPKDPNLRQYYVA